MSVRNLFKSVEAIQSRLDLAADKLDDSEEVPPTGSPAYNAEMLAVGLAFGDDGRLPRDVRHIIAPPKGDQRFSNVAVREALSAMDGRFEHSFETGSLIFIQHVATTPDVFDPISAQVAEIVAGLDWDYAAIEIPLRPDPKS